MEPLNFQKNITFRTGDRSFIGISVGCFFGSGYGFFLGLGQICCVKNKISLVYPSRMPFLHIGYLGGCFCGVAIGYGFTNGAGFSMGFKEQYEISSMIKKLSK